MSSAQARRLLVAVAVAIVVAPVVAGCATGSRAGTRSGAVSSPFARVSLSGSAASAAATGVVGTSTERAPSIDSVPPGGASPVQDADDAITIAERDTAEFGGATVYSAKLFTYRDLDGTVINPGPPYGRTANEKVWVVTFVGAVTSDVAPGASAAGYDWGAMLVDPPTGYPAGTVANKGAVPEILHP